MKISYNWLKNYINIPVSTEELSVLLTDCGLEVESMEPIDSVKGGLAGIVIGEVLTCEKHPDADRLSLTTVHVGHDTILNIVCGAPNVAAGQKVAVATIGAKMYQGEEVFEIKKSKIRGHLSEGMICAEDELGLGHSHDGIMVLDPLAVVGTPAADYFNIERDTVFEIGLTPNRSDATSHVGVARDIAAVLNAKNGNQIHQLKYPDVSGFSITNNNIPIPVEVLDQEACPRYSGISIQDVKVGDSPDWLKNKLTAVGLRPINNIVDITNYVLMELGQPLHAFDADKITGKKVIVCKASEGTEFVTLDGVKRKLSAQDLMICNGEKEGMCIAGVFGGEHSGVTSETKNIFLESAYFNPVNIRKTARFHGLKTDASFRYERGADPNITVYALKRAALLIQSVAGGTIASDLQDVYPNKIEKTPVCLSFEKLNKTIGKIIPEATIKNILRSLEIDIIKETAEALDLRIPTNKTDVTREADVIEEILRIYGYNQVETTGMLRSSFAFSQKPDTEKIYQKTANLLTFNGFSEIMCNSLTKADYAEKINDFGSEKSVIILNPLSNELNAMRQSLLFGGLESITFNINRKNTNLKFYEFGQVYQKNTQAKSDDAVLKRFSETQHLGIWITGNKKTENWAGPDVPVDFFHLKSMVNMIIESLNLGNMEIEQQTPSYFSYGLTYFLHSKPIVSFGKLNANILKDFDVKQDVFYADFHWTNIKKYIPVTEILYKEVPKFPEVRRDLALLLDKNITFGEISKLAYQTEKKLLQKVNLFDVYEGDKLPENKKSYALSFILQDEEKTLTDQQIDKVMSKLMQTFESQLGASIR